MTHVDALKLAMARTGIPFEEIKSGKVAEIARGTYRVVMLTEDGRTLTEVVAG